MLLQHRFNQVDSQIVSVESQIRDLQEQLSQLQQHRQHLQSVEQACESALAQIDTALMMLNHVDPECVPTFKDAVMAKFNDAIATLPEATDPTPEPDTAPEPTEPEPTDAIDVEVTTEPEAEEAEPTPEPQNGKQLASVGAAGFDPLTADLDTLKRWVRQRQQDGETKQQGSLTRRATWEAAANKLLAMI